MTKKEKATSNIALFEHQEVRRVWHENQWYFSVADVVEILSETSNVRDYIKKMRLRDRELESYWGTICPPVEMIAKDGKKRKITASSLEGIFRIIQSIPSKKAEPFKRWLARVGKERIDEIQNPELAMERMRELYEKKGYPKDWIDKRMRGIAVRHGLTDEWQKRGATIGKEFAILTNEIMQGAFDMKPGEYGAFKGLGKQDNLRDHMNDIELILTMLAEATTTNLTQNRDSHGFEPLRRDAKDGGDVAGRTRKDIETRSGKRVSTRENFLDFSKQKKIKGKKEK